MDRMDLILLLGMLCLIGGTLLTGFSRPLWWALHQRGPDGRRDVPAHYEWYLRIPGIVLLKERSRPVDGRGRSALAAGH